MIIGRDDVDPLRTAASGAGGALDDPDERARRGTVRKARRFPRLRARLTRLIRG